MALKDGWSDDASTDRIGEFSKRSIRILKYNANTEAQDWHGHSIQFHFCSRESVVFHVLTGEGTGFVRRRLWKGGSHLIWKTLEGRL